MDMTQAVSTLNDLIQTCREGEQGFRAAAGAMKEPHVRVLFERYARQRGEMSRELEETVGGLGGKVQIGGSVSGSLHRGWVNIKTLVTGRDEAALIAEAERGEDIATAAYAKALACPLPAGARELVEQQVAIVRATRDELRLLGKSHVH